MMIAAIIKFWGENPNGSDQMGHIINNFHFARLSKLLLTSGGDTIYGGETNAKHLHI